jgi:hypothetical protein
MFTVWYRISPSGRWFAYRQQYIDNAEGEKAAKTERGATSGHMRACSPSSWISRPQPFI